MLENKTLSDRIYELLKQEIVQAVLKPGEKLSEVQLAKRFDVSRAPIRGAISKLQQERLVIVKPQIGTIVSPISLKKAADILQVRLLLEPFAAELAAANFTDAAREELQDQFRKLENIKNVSPRYKQVCFETDELLHQTIWKLCGNDEIRGTLDKYRHEIQRIRISNSDLAHRLMPSYQEIREIYEALLERSPVRARLTMSLHILNTKNTVEAFLKENENGTEEPGVS